MLNKRILLISAGTAACALGIGFFMQPEAKSYTGAEERAGLHLPQEPALTTPLAIEKITLTSANPDENRTGGIVPGAESRLTPIAACRIKADGQAMPGAVVALQVSAPCRSGERITLHHQGMMFTATLDKTGQLDLLIPALSSSAIFIVEPTSVAPSEGFTPATATGTVVQVAVPDMDQVDRVVLQWSGNSGFEIHAREFGAQYGELGHVWHGADPSLGRGQLVQLGDPAQLVPRLAEIYSFRRDDSVEPAGVIEISVEAEITEINCGREIAAQSLRIVGGQVQSRDLVLNMPDCTATGDFLVLNNLVENLKIAAK